MFECAECGQDVGPGATVGFSLDGEEWFCRDCIVEEGGHAALDQLDGMSDDWEG